MKKSRKTWTDPIHEICDGDCSRVVRYPKVVGLEHQVGDENL